ncbi:hypothetical protein [uncultured Mediterranean phage uvMED]|nr:hypothetical protein [uncultured Mediterranean phage uvMED]BAR19073.1 hypothetical protein [uncultured Mediterranean phage uvMED]BAR19104.1 hypothetical protein [uncultured Mediterranean phage uvMED]
MSILKGLLANEDLLIGLGLLSGGSQGQGIGQAGINSVLQAAQIKKAFKPTARKTVKGADGFQYFVDTGERALPNVEKEVKDTRTPLMKNVEALYPKGSKEYNEAMLTGISKTELGLKNTSPFIKGTNIDTAISNAEFSSGNLDLITNIANKTTNNPSIFGSKGVALKLGKNVKNEFQGIFGNQIKNSGELEDGVMGLLDNKDLSTLGIMENSLSIGIARSRNRTGKLMKDMIVDAKDDAKLTGLGGVKGVRDKLPALFNEQLNFVKKNYELAGKTEEEIAAILNPQIRAFNEAMALKEETNEKQKRGLPKNNKGKLVYDEEKKMWVRQ